MRVLSPSSEPFVRVEEGSTASTATRWPLRMASMPSRSIKVLLPAPGMPVMPSRWVRRSGWWVRRRSSSLRAWCSGSVLSTHVMAWASASRCPASTALARDSAVQECTPWMEDFAKLRARARASEEALSVTFGRYVKERGGKPAGAYFVDMRLKFMAVWWGACWASPVGRKRRRTPPGSCPDRVGEGGRWIPSSMVVNRRSSAASSLAKTWSFWCA